MATNRSDSVLRQIRTLFSLGHVGDRADGELLEWFEAHHAEAQAAFEELVARHGGMVLDVCRRILRDPHDVDDAFQATFLVLVRRAGSIRDGGALGGWLHRVALRVALRAKAEAARRRTVEQQAAAAGTAAPTPDDIERGEVRTAVHEELDRLSAPYRVALVACHIEGLTHEEAASRLGWPVGTVRSRLARGRDRLRSRLARRGLAPGVALAALAGRAEAVPASLQSLAARTISSYVAGQPLVGTVPAPVAALAQKVVRAMRMRTLRLFAAVALTVGAIAGVSPLWAVRAPLRAVAAARAEKPAPSRVLAGVVRDSGGRPIAGATVVAGVFSGQPNHEIATTREDGRFSFSWRADARPLNYVIAYKEGLAPASKLRIARRDTTPAEDVELVLRRADLFVGSVRDRDGRPIHEARVQVKYMRGAGGKYDNNPILANVVQDTPLEWMFNTVADGQGDFRFPAVPAPQRVVLLVRAEGKADLSTEVPGDYEAGFISGTVANPARLTMEPEARVGGRVVTGMPGVRVEGLKIGLQSTQDSPQFWRDEFTDAAGRFEFRGLPEGGANIFPIDHPSDGPWTYRAVDNLALHPGKTAEVTIELIEGCRVEGKVIDTATGGPISGKAVSMYGPARPGSGAAILIATTDDEGRYRFRLPPGKTYLYTSGAGPRPSLGMNVVIPIDAKTFAVPALKLPGAKDATRPAPRPPAASNETSPATVKAIEPDSIAGVVRDVSDRPIGGATVVGAVFRQEQMVHRQVATTAPDGRFALKPADDDDPKAIARFYAFKDGFAPAGLSRTAIRTQPVREVSLVLARTRPFVGIVEDRDENPIRKAEVRVQSIKAPVPGGAGTTVTEVSWPAIEGTSLEGVFRATTDDGGRFRLPSMPARSQLNLVVTAEGMVTHRTMEFTRPGWTGRWPSGFEDGFLHGTPDAPAILYLTPRGPRGGRN